jgi:hypothetical protein
MTTATFVQPNNTAQDPTTYKGSIDASFAALVGIAGQFAPHQQTAANMTVVVDAGSVLNGTVLTSKAQQSTGVIAAPATNPRIDRVVVDTANGTVSVITGTENATPVAPALTTGKAPVAQVLLQTTSNSITNSMITDERNFYNNSVLSAVTADSLKPLYQFSVPSFVASFNITSQVDWTKYDVLRIAIKNLQIQTTGNSLSFIFSFDGSTFLSTSV